MTSDERRLSHLDDAGRAHMVDVAGKQVTERRAVARAVVRMEPETFALLRDGKAKKGDVLAAARIAGIQASKRTPELIPLCHTIALTAAEVRFEFGDDGASIRIEAECRATDRTGVEMEALTAVSIAALTLYDMLKAVDRAMTITDIALVEKSGGASGDFKR
ncbi:MAG: cyclic pyranopterin monophosphate synthase MoaC [Polyangiales bacterium]